MGLSLWMVADPCPTCGEGLDRTDSFHYTYNVSRMWREASPGDERMVQIEGMTGTEALQKLKKVIDELLDKPRKYHDMQPENNWGSYTGFIEFLEKLVDLSHEYPNWIWKASR